MSYPLKESRSKVNDFVAAVAEASKECGIDGYVVVGLCRVDEKSTADPPTVEGVVVNTGKLGPEWGLILAGQLMGYAKRKFQAEHIDYAMNKAQCLIGTGMTREDNRQKSTDD